MIRRNLSQLTVDLTKVRVNSRTSVIILLLSLEMKIGQDLRDEEMTREKTPESMSNHHHKTTITWVVQYLATTEG